MSRSVWSERSGALPALVSIALALVCVAPRDARADMLPSNTRPCDGLSPGASCTTDRCNAGSCGVLEGRVRCPASDLGACLACQISDAGSCDKACERKTAPCFVCLPNDFQKELAEARSTTSTDRFFDCQQRKLGDTCRTEACDVGKCAASFEGAADLVCVVPQAASHAKSLLVLAIVALVVGGATAGLAHKRRSKDSTNRPS